jgi:hypothetical protein
VVTVRKLLLAVGVLALAVVGGAAVTGVGPFPGGGDAGGSEAEPFPTATEGTGTAGDATATGPAFAFGIDRIETCGQTCRDVTSTLRNEGDDRATGVVVSTRVFVGNGTDGDVIWRGTERVGALAAGEAHTATRRVELSYSEGLAVRRADGWITVQTTVASDQRTVTFADRRQVA